MRALLVVVVVIAVLGLLALVLARRAGRGRDLVGAQLAATGTADRRAPERLDDVQLRRQVEAMLRQRGKIQAIKLLRDHHPMSLRDAKEAVERIEAGAGGPVWPAAPPPATPAWAMPLSPADLPADVLAQIRELKSRHQLILAIKLLRQHTGMGLRDAKDAVERL